MSATVIREVSVALPRLFCWTRFGTEAGEPIDEIFARKERERVMNGGLFLWGIGNAIWPSMRELLSLEVNPEAVFSPIRSAPRKDDIAPEMVVRWTAGRSMDGQRYEFPAGAVVTSRQNYNRRQTSHYALVCASAVALRVDTDGEPLVFARLRNLVTGRPVGASQVTAIVRQCDDDCGANGVRYRAALRVQLVFPYLVQLIDSVSLPPPLNAARHLTIAQKA
jgi:hypothetical protein